MKALGKILLAVVLGFAAWFASQFAAGVLIAILAAVFHVNAATARFLATTLPYIFFLGAAFVLCILLLRKRRRASPFQDRTSM